MFNLPFHIAPSEAKIRLKDPVITMGSCFSEEIGKKFTQYKFNTLANPFGVIYNPSSIFKSLRMTLTNGFDPEHHIQQAGIYYHWDSHSTISAPTREELELLLKSRTEETRKLLIKAKWLIISFGTSFIYRHNGNIVANCHKVPQATFEKELLTPTSIIEDFSRTLEVLQAANPKLNIIFTISPVRHIRDGLMENNLSKAILLQAVHEIVRKEKNTCYFPAYELVMDVLRDYRYYKEDMIHPNDQAVRYIWEQFVATYMDPGTQTFIEDWGGILKSLNHKPFHSGSLAHQSFLRATIKNLKKFSGKVDISTELKALQNQLTD